MARVGPNTYALPTTDGMDLSVRGGPPSLLSDDGVRLDGRLPQESRPPCKCSNNLKPYHCLAS